MQIQGDLQHSHCACARASTKPQQLCMHPAPSACKPSTTCSPNMLFRVCTWLVLLSSTAAALSTTDVPVALWRHVLNTEPNRHIEQLAQYSEEPGRLTRTFFSVAHKQAAQQLRLWMEQAGMHSWVDALGNVHGVVQGSDPKAPVVILGSHYDTIVNAGKYDGNLGVILAIAAVKGLLLQALVSVQRTQELKQLQDKVSSGGYVSDLVLSADSTRGLLPSGVHVVGFCDEEGIRFRSTFLGSRALAGTLLRYNQLEAVDAAGLTVGDVLRREGVLDPAAAIEALALSPDRVRHYVEFHIEQGPVLQAQGVPLGVVSGIAGQTWLNVHIVGEQGHAGTVPMHMRADPLAAAAEAVLMVETLCKGLPWAAPGGTEDQEPSVEPVTGEALVCTVGRLVAQPGQVNIIPGAVNFTVDMRSRRDDFRDRMRATLTGKVAELCARRGVDCSVEVLHSAAAVQNDPGLTQKLAAAIKASRPLGALLAPHHSHAAASQQDTSEAAAVPVLLSGAGHDAMAMAELTRTSMVFVRCKDGISHNPLEHTTHDDVAAAAAAFATFLERDVLGGGMEHPGDGEGQGQEEASAADEGAPGGLSGTPRDEL